jgi:hypothetical protein
MERGREEGREGSYRKGKKEGREEQQFVLRSPPR